MGIFAYPIAAKIEDVQNKFGCKDEQLFEKIIEENSDLSDELEDIIFNYVPIKDRIPTKPKFFGLIKGNDGSGMFSEWYKYFYALFKLSQFVGKDLTNESDIFKYGSDWWQTIDSLLDKINSKFRLERMAEYKRLFDTPFEENEGCTSIYERNEIPEFYEDFLKIESQLNHADEELMECYNEFKKALKYCKDNNLDMLTFMT